MKKIETATNLISDVDQLKKTVYTGNGEPSLVSQIATLTTTVEFLEKSLNDKMQTIESSMDQTKCCIEEKIEHLADTIEDREIRQAQSEGRKTHVQTAVIAGVISIIIAILTVIFKA